MYFSLAIIKLPFINVQPRYSSYLSDTLKKVAGPQGNEKITSVINLGEVTQKIKRSNQPNTATAKLVNGK